MKIAKSFKIINNLIQLFDEAGKPLAGKGTKWEGHFDCSHNQLTSLEGAPEVIGGNFDCQYNQLTTLKGAPEQPTN